MLDPGPRHTTAQCSPTYDSTVFHFQLVYLYCASTGLGCRFSLPRPKTHSTGTLRLQTRPPHPSLTSRLF